MVPEIIKPHHMVTFYYNKNPEKHICKEQNTNKTSMVQETPSILRSKRPRHNNNTRQHNILSRSHHPWIWSPQE